MAAKRKENFTHHPFLSRHLALLGALILIAPLAVWAGGSQEADVSVEASDHDHDDHDHDGDEHDHVEGIPHVDPLVAAGERLGVVATTTIVGDVVRNVIGDAADLSVLLAVGDNPHSFEPTPSILRTLERADIVITNGLNLEEDLLDDLDAMATGPVIPLSAGIEPLEGGHHDHDHAHSGGDPHVWMDPNNAIVWVENLVGVLSEADPANEAAYRENGAAYIAELREIDAWIRAEVSRVPAPRRKLVLDHETFSYFADEYGFETVGAIVPQTTDRAEPSAQAVARLVDTIRSESVSAIFVGRTASRSLQRLAETVAAEVGREVLIVPTLTGSLTAPGEPGDTYVGFLRYNVEQIVTALGD